MLISGILADNEYANTKIIILGIKKDNKNFKNNLLLYFGNLISELNNLFCTIVLDSIVKYKKKTDHF